VANASETTAQPARTPPESMKAVTAAAGRAPVEVRLGQRSPMGSTPDAGGTNFAVYRQWLVYLETPGSTTDWQPQMIGNLEHSHYWVNPIPFKSSASGPAKLSAVFPALLRTFGLARPLSRIWTHAVIQSVLTSASS
jgi:hypothetical protein